MLPLTDRVFDVAIIGGGILGVSVARDCAMRRLSVALFEKDDSSSGTTGAGSGTSATVRSSRLPSSGAMKRIVEDTSTGAPMLPTSLMFVMSIQPQSDSGLVESSVSPASAASRIHVDRVFRQAL